MELAAAKIKDKAPYSELKQLLMDWEHSVKVELFLDLAIVHKNKEGVRLVGDLYGEHFYMSPYDVQNKVTPIYVAQLLSRLHPEYAELASYMLQRIENNKPWNRRRPFLWAWTQRTQKLFCCLPKPLLRAVALEYL